MTETRQHYECEFAGERILLLPERALFFPAENTLIVADLHWGKAAAFRADYVPVPTGTTASDLTRLSAAVQSTGAERVVILGDLLHARKGRQEGTFNTIANWRKDNKSLDVVLVRGNHDELAGDPPSTLGINCRDAPLHIGPFTCVHDPEDDFVDGAIVMAGHLHPSIALTGRARERVRLPCFVFSDTLAILPAFSSFTGGGMYEYVEGDRLFVIVDEQVLPVRTYLEES